MLSRAVILQNMKVTGVTYLGKETIGYFLKAMTLMRNLLFSLNNLTGTLSWTGSRLFHASSLLRHLVTLRGLPYEATEQDVVNFLLPLKPTSVRVEKNFRGMCNGFAKIEFATTEEAYKTTEKHNQYMGRRYIEVLVDGAPPPPRRYPPRQRFYNSYQQQQFYNPYQQQQQFPQPQQQFNNYPGSQGQPNYPPFPPQGPVRGRF